ncbi:MAG: sulfide/dihydroorotate dehydrogenase-like FAD/NAD-binding protein, partial [Kiritimatiellae bacterium]|nr:sulfide/dihydroorotate dehydrogenase-like FAD/NAD-binding protein [Kiritimatiellia bacterium]
NRELVIVEEEFKACADRFIVVTDDGSYGEQGNVTAPLKALLESGERFDEVFAIGPLVMMKYVSLTTKEYDQKTTVSMNTIMIDGTGMCGGCRLTVGGEMRFACVDGPDFDAHLVDFDEAISRSRSYARFERTAHEKTCNLFQKEVL